MTKVTQLYDEVNFNIAIIIDKIKKTFSISIKKIIEVYKNEFGIALSKTTVNRKLRNKLNYSFKKTILKPIDLNKLNYTKMSFIFIKIIILAKKLKFNLIFIDESNFKLENPNFKTWIKKMNIQIMVIKKW